MATRDVELVIRARDQATNAIKTFTTALEQIVNANDKINQSAKGTGTTLERLGATIKEIAGAVAAVSPTGKLSEQTEKAAQSVHKLEQGLVELRAEAERLAIQQREAAGDTVRYALEQERLEKALKEQKAAIKEAEGSYAQLSKALLKAGKDANTLAVEEDQLRQKIITAEQAVIKQSARYGELAAQTAKVVNPTKTFAASLQAAVVAQDKAEAKLKELSAALRENQAAIAANATSTPQLVVALGQAEARLAELKGSFNALTQEYAEFNQKTDQVVRNQRELEKSTQIASREINKQAGILDKSKTGYRELATTIREAEQAVEELAKALGGRLTAAMNNQRIQALNARRAWNESSRAVAELAAEMRVLGESADLTRRQQIAIAQQRALKEAYDINRSALIQMRQAIVQTGDSFEGLATRQERFQSITRETATAIDRLEQATRREIVALERAGPAASRAAQGIHQTGTAAAASTGKMLTFSQALNRFYGGTRQSLSLLQRARGQVLAYVAAHAGLFAIFTSLRRVVDSYQRLEAATSRLNVIFSGDLGGVAQELDFLERTAARLGIQFGTLSDLYTKFAVATKGTNLEGANTRKIFLAVAEAGRVNKLTIDQMRGAFLALEQMVSKGSITMEELRRQLGERIPGAFNIMADALGVTTQELNRMVKAGSVTPDALIAFAEELNKRFGSQLPQALRTTTTEIGRFQNTLFQTALRFGEAGFIESFTNLLKTMNEELQSSRADSFFARLSVAVGGLADLLSYLIRNFELVTTAIGIFIGVKIIPFVSVMIANLVRLRVALLSLPVALAIVRTNFIITTAAATGFISTIKAATVGLVTFLTTLKGAAAASGVGLALVAIGGAIGYWITQTDSATDALNAHEKAVKAVKDAYEANNAEVEGLRQKLENISFTAAVTTLQQLNSAVENNLDSLDSMVSQMELVARNGDEVFQSITGEVRLLLDEFRKTKDIDTFVKRIDAIGQAAFEAGNDGVFKLANDYIKVTEEGRKFIEGARGQELIIQLLTGSIEEQRAAIQELSKATQADLYSDLIAGADKAKKASDALKDSLDRAGDIIDKISEQAEDAGDNVEFFKDNLVGISVTQIEAELKTLLESLDNVNQQMADMISGVDQPSPESSKLALLIEMFDSGQITIEQFRRKVDELAQTAGNESIAGMAKDMLDMLDATGDVRQAAARLAIILRVAKGESKDLRADLELLAQEDVFAKTNAGLEKLIRGFHRVNENRLTFIKRSKDELSFLQKFNAELEKDVGKRDEFGDAGRGAEALKGKFSEAEQAVRDFEAKTLTSFDAVNDKAKGSADEVGRVASAFDLIDQAKAEGLAGSFDTVTEGAKTATTEVGALADKSVETFKTILEETNKLSSQTSQQLLTTNQEFFTSIAEQFQTATNELIESSQARIEQFKSENLESAGQYTTLILELFNGLREAINQVVSQTQTDASRIGTAMQEGASTAESAIEKMVNAAIADLNRLVAAARQAAAAIAAIGGASGKASGGPTFTPRGLARGGPAIKGRAGGGQVRGRGTSTSDSNLFALSNMEWIIQGAAVRYYGNRFMQMVNEMRLPKMARGGSTVTPMRTGGSTGTRTKGGGGTVVLNIGDQRFEAFADDKTFRSLSRTLKKRRPRAAGKLTLKDAY